MRRLSERPDLAIRLFTDGYNFEINNDESFDIYYANLNNDDDKYNSDGIFMKDFNRLCSYLDNHDIMEEFNYLINKCVIDNI